MRWCHERLVRWRHIRAAVDETQHRCTSPHTAYTPCVYAVCIVLGMSIGHTLLGLLESGPRHGYDLKRAFDEKFGHDRPLHYGQVYSTMSRLLKNGLVEVDGIEAGDGPERKRYAITEAGVTDVQRWLATPEKPEPYLQSTPSTRRSSSRF